MHSARTTVIFSPVPWLCEVRRSVRGSKPNACFFLLSKKRGRTDYAQVCCCKAHSHIPCRAAPRRGVPWCAVPRRGVLCRAAPRRGVPLPSDVAFRTWTEHGMGTA